MSYPPDHHPKLRERYESPPQALRGRAPRSLSQLCFIVAFIMGYVAFMLYGEGKATWDEGAMIAGGAFALGVLLRLLRLSR